jgi:hypothetical protein
MTVAWSNITLLPAERREAFHFTEHEATVNHRGKCCRVNDQRRAIVCSKFSQTD